MRQPLQAVIMAGLHFVILFFSILCGGCTHILWVETQPEGARVYLDGEYCGQTPLRSEYDIVFDFADTLRTIEVALPGYRTETVRMSEGNLDRYPFKITLEPDNALVGGRTREGQAITHSGKLPPRDFPLRNIAIAGLEPLAVTDAEALTLSESLRTAIVDSDYFTVVSRADTKRILEEQDFQQSDLSDTRDLVRIGKILAAEKIIGGSVGRVGDTFSISIRMVDVETAQIDVSQVKDVKGREDELLKAIRELGKSMCVKYAKDRLK